MIVLLSGKPDLFQASATALVNPVNTVGVMGKGLAKAFAERMPEACAPYFEAHRANRLAIGKILAVPVSRPENPALKWVIHFPTKESWRRPSEMSFIQAALEDLRRFLLAKKVHSVAMPAIGCGEGGLPFAWVAEPWSAIWATWRPMSCFSRLRVNPLRREGQARLTDSLQQVPRRSGLGCPNALDA